MRQGKQPQSPTRISQSFSQEEVDCICRILGYVMRGAVPRTPIERAYRTGQGTAVHKKFMDMQKRISENVEEAKHAG